MKKALAPLPKCRESYNEMDAVRQKKVDGHKLSREGSKPTRDGTFGPFSGFVCYSRLEFGKSSSVEQLQGIGTRELG